MVLKKTLGKKLANDYLWTFIIPNTQDIKINFSINTINIIMTLAIFIARLSLKLRLGFNKKCKKIQIKAKRLKKIWEKRRMKRKLERLLNYSNKKKPDNSKKQKKRIASKKKKHILLSKVYKRP